MPKYDKEKDDVIQHKKHKKHKHRHAEEHDEESRPSKKSRYHSSSSDESLTRRRSSKAASSHRSEDRRNTDKSAGNIRLKKVKKEKNAPDEGYSRDEFRYRRVDVEIKREEDFDRRQEDLRRRRRANSRERRRPDNMRSRERTERDERIAEAFTKPAAEEDEKTKEKEKPNLGLSGALTEDTNTFQGVVIKYNEPPEARTPKKRWRLYPFKGTESLKPLHLHRQSAFLLGRQRRIADIPVDHPSCSKQHAVLQFRVMDVQVDGKLRRRVKPYVIDLGSANGTYVNNERVEPQRYVELREQDVLKFGFSSREYVLLHDKSDTSQVSSSSEDEED